MDTVLLKWESTGLLEGLDPSHKPDVARMLESVALELFQRTVTTGEILKIGESHVANLIFPIARRLWGSWVDITNPPGLFEHFMGWLSKRNPLPSTLDEEVEVCHEYTLQVAKEFFHEGKHGSWLSKGNGVGNHIQ